MIDKKKLAQKALYQALKVRQNLNIDLLSPVCIFDIVEKYGIEIQFTDTKSMEGMYVKEPGPYILIGAYRPAGRQIFTCAHEFGHHIFNHGTRVDEIKVEKPDLEDEYLVDSFAGFLLMPQFAVNRTIKDRGWDITRLNSEHIFILATYFGVGYSTLLYHFHYSLKLIPYSLFECLSKFKRKEIISGLVNRDLDEDLIVVDSFWQYRPVDLQVGNYLYIPADMQSEGNTLIHLESDKMNALYQATKPGLGRFYSPERDHSIYCRVSRKEYIGRNKFKHLEDPDYE